MKDTIVRRLLFYFLICFCAYLFIPSAYAADFRTLYDIEYFIKDTDTLNLTKTSYTITLTNLRPDMIIKKFTLVIPRSFGISDIVAKDLNGGITPTVVEKERTIEASFELNKPKAGLNEINVIYLDFLQKNIFRTKGTIWEVFIPTLENKDGDTSTITVNLPVGKNRKLSLAKPLPDLVTFEKVVWNKSPGRSIYAVFGTDQRYAMDLTYHLVNPNVYKVYTDIAFPPDTLYQKIVIESLVPAPNLVYSDADGNFIGRYNLDLKEEKKIVFKGIAYIYGLPRSDYKSYIQRQFQDQQKTLFNAQPLWALSTETPVTSSNIKDHYDYTLKTLSYNFSRVIKGDSRMGSTEALKYPDQAVCTEYSDLLIASARQRGIYVREVQGFAFANEQELRPISAESDILHSWVEYFDLKKYVWVPIDPTWEDTSGMDYFNSFDFNHIVFALHGKQADSPHPAGSYKTTSGGRDIRIEPTTKSIVENTALASSLALYPLPSAQSSFTVDLEIANKGNVSLWNIPLSITAENAIVDISLQHISHLLPFEKKKIIITFTPQSSLFYQDVTFIVKQGDTLLLSQSVKVPTFFTSFKGYLIPAGCVIGGILVLILLFKKRDEER